MIKYFVDTNIILRYLLAEDPTGKIAKLINSKSHLIIPDIVLAEVVWVLDRSYKWPKMQIIEFISALLKRDNTEYDKKIISYALSLFARTNIKYTDAYIASLMNQKKVSSIYTFDKEFDRVKDITRIEPK